MKTFTSIKFYLYLFIIAVVFNLKVDLNSDSSLYYEEKEFRFLTNNYELIDESFTLEYLDNEKGIGFRAKDDNQLGNAIIIKDWSMYKFNLNKVVFRPYCTINLDNKDNCKAEMWLYHTKDNTYYPPGRRIYLNTNYFVIIVPFYKNITETTKDANSIFHFINLEKFLNSSENVSPLKPIKLYHIIQNQPSYLFTGNMPVTNQETLYMVFTQYHTISETDLTNLKNAYNKHFNDQNYEISKRQEFYRNEKELLKIKPEGTKLPYNKSSFIKNGLLATFIFLRMLF